MDSSVNNDNSFIDYRTIAKDHFNYVDDTTETNEGHASSSLVNDNSDIESKQIAKKSDASVQENIVSGAIIDNLRITPHAQDEVISTRSESSKRCKTPLEINQQCANDALSSALDSMNVNHSDGAFPANDKLSCTEKNDLRPTSILRNHSGFVNIVF